MTTVKERHEARLAAIRKNLQQLPIEDDVTYPIKLPPPPAPTVISTLAEDKEELLWLRYLVSGKNEPTSSTLTTLLAKKNIPVDMGSKEVLAHYTNECIQNSHFKLRKLKGRYLVSFRNQYYRDLLYSSTEAILTYTNEILRMTYGYKRLKTANDLDNAIMSNSIKIRIGEMVDPTATPVLYSLGVNN
ncbi:hypothetical protein CcNV_071 [Crangon crangon nudivirus]|uniref:Uncharacterized protein n=1 Tax=Crangon crangon nudivirus TaxID=2880838 RepID=A0AAE8Y0R2_9VIRU|nr:hypothetical protein QKT25_gp072 [Crangon crangon nudivirus]UBZ25556.1 hypothetical protein CcNV_071 [Crangon crangon nudivirus]